MAKGTLTSDGALSRRRDNLGASSTEAKFASLHARIGATRCVAVEFETGVVHVKLESDNPTGSVKDRACVWLIERAFARRDFRPGMRLLDASSGNMACAIAYFGRLLGVPTTVVVSSKLTEEKREFLEYFGASLKAVGTFTFEGNEYCRALAASRPSEYAFLDQLNDWANPRAHYYGTGPELLRDVPNLGMVVGSLGSGGTMSGLGEYIRAVRPRARIVAVEGAAGSRIPGTGAFVDGDYVTPFIRRARRLGIFDAVVRVGEEEAWRQMDALRDQGVFTGLQGGAVLHAAVQEARRDPVAGDTVIIVGDSGWKNLGRLMSRPSSPAAFDGRARTMEHSIDEGRGAD